MPKIKGRLTWDGDLVVALNRDVDVLAMCWYAIVSALGLGLAAFAAFEPEMPLRPLIGVLGLAMSVSVAVIGVSFVRVCFQGWRDEDLRKSKQSR